MNGCRFDNKKDPVVEELIIAVVSNSCTCKILYVTDAAFGAVGSDHDICIVLGPCADREGSIIPDGTKKGHFVCINNTYRVLHVNFAMEHYFI